MKKLFLIIMLICSTPLMASLEVETAIFSFSNFSGDSHDAFKGDLVVHLEDGSAWKVHPKDQNKITRWELGNKVHVAVRTSHYYTKREHKYLLCNDDRDVDVRAMRVDHGELYPLQVEAVSKVYTENSYWDLYWDPASGLLIPYKVYEKAMDVFLNDGRGYIIRKNFSAFKPDALVYICCNKIKINDKECIYYSMAANIEGESNYAWFYT